MFLPIQNISKKWADDLYNAPVRNKRHPVGDAALKKNKCIATGLLIVYVIALTCEYLCVGALRVCNFIVLVIVSSLWLVDEDKTVVTNTNCYTTTNETKTLVYKSGYGVITKTYYARARVVTGSATTSTTLKYRLTP